MSQIHSIFYMVSIEWRFYNYIVTVKTLYHLVNVLFHFSYLSITDLLALLYIIFGKAFELLIEISFKNY